MARVFLFLQTVSPLVNTLLVKTNQMKVASKILFSLFVAAERPRAPSLEWQELLVKTERGAQPPVPHRDLDG